MAAAVQGSDSEKRGGGRNAQGGERVGFSMALAPAPVQWIGVFVIGTSVMSDCRPSSSHALLVELGGGYMWGYLMYDLADARLDAFK
ncbi:unnamed protein product [Gadus morhua 'NCC']